MPISELVEWSSGWDVHRNDLASAVVYFERAFGGEELLSPEVRCYLAEFLDRDAEVQYLSQPADDICFALHPLKCWGDRVQVVCVAQVSCFVDEPVGSSDVELDAFFFEKSLFT